MYAVVHPPNFAAQAAARALPELRRKPFALVHGEPPGELVHATNRMAQSLGVETGMSRLQVESIPGIAVVWRDPEHEAAAHLALHAAACGFSPRIETVPAHPGTYALDIKGMETMYGDASQLAGKLRRAVMAAGFVAHIAVAPNFHVAAAVAYGRTGISVVPAGCEADAMRNLPVDVLNLAEHQQATFQSWGIHTCGELAALKETDLVARMGQAGRALHLLARGELPHLMTPMEPSFEASLTERMELDHPVDLLEPLLFLLARMTEALLERVQARSRAIASLRVVLRLDNGKLHERIVRPALPLYDRPTLLKLVQLDLEMHPPVAAIVGLELQAQSAPPYRAQHGLFLPQAPEPGRLEVLLARLRKLLGEQGVGSPELIDDHRANAFRLTPFTPPPPAKSRTEPLTVSALRVSRPPRVVGVVLSGGVPTQVFCDGERYRVQDVAGPWRVSGRWWSEASWCREEWDVRLGNETTERVCRIAFDPRPRCWYLQGTYD